MKVVNVFIDPIVEDAIRMEWAKGVKGAAQSGSKQVEGETLLDCLVKHTDGAVNFHSLNSAVLIFCRRGTHWERDRQHHRHWSDNSKYFYLLCYILSANLELDRLSNHICHLSSLSTPRHIEASPRRNLVCRRCRPQPQPHIRRHPRAG